MKQLVFITYFFLTSQMCLASKEQLTLHSDEIIEVMIKYAEENPIIKYVGIDHKVNSDTVAGNLRQVFDVLKNLGDTFKYSVINYFYTKLELYCQAVIELIEKTSNKNVINAIKFDNNCDFCVLSFLYDFRYNNIDQLLHIIQFLKIIQLGHIDLQSVSDQLHTMLVEYFHNDHYNENNKKLKQLKRKTQPIKTNKDSLSMSTNEKKEPHNFIKDKNQEDFEKKNIIELIKYLSDLKKEIQTISNLFCLPTTVPLENKEFFHRKYNNPKPDFIDTIFKSDKCYVTYKFRDTKIETQQLKIDIWTCQYKLNWMTTMNEQALDCLSIIGCITPRIKQKYVVTRVDDKEVTLASLSNELQINNYFTNILKYYNIASDIMILNGIKEVGKILYEVKYAFAYHSKKKLNYDYICEMRLRLFIANLFFEGLIKRIFEKLRYDCTIYSYVNVFRGKVIKILDLLETKKDFNLVSIKSDINKELEEMDSTTDVDKKKVSIKYNNNPVLELDHIENVYLLFNFKLIL